MKRKERYNTDDVVEILAYEHLLLTKCPICNVYVNRDKILFLHPLLKPSDTNERFMCKKCYNDILADKFDSDIE
jgi:hypothetical protein